MVQQIKSRLSTLFKAVVDDVEMERRVETPRQRFYRMAHRMPVSATSIALRRPSAVPISPNTAYSVINAR